MFIKMCTVVVMFYIFLPQLISAYPQSQRVTDIASISDCGKSTSKSPYPWIAAIYDPEEKLICTGTIITPYHILTAGGCFILLRTNDSIYSPGNLEHTIVAGRHYSNIHRKTSTQQNRKLDKVLIYLNLVNDNTVEHSALIKLDRKLDFTDYVRPVCMDYVSHCVDRTIRDGDEAVVIGWKYEKDEVVSCTLDVQYWQKHVCKRNLPDDQKAPFEDHSDLKFCLRYLEDKSKCIESPGAGVFFKSRQQRYFLKGISDVVYNEWRGYALPTRIRDKDIDDWEKVVRESNLGLSSLTFRSFERDLGCNLPRHLRNGQFSLVTGKAYPEDAWVPSSTVIFLTCDANKASTLSYRCIDSQWYPPITNMVCKTPGSCPSLAESRTEEVFCKLNGGPISCHEPPVNTTAIVVCRPFHRYPGPKPVYQCIHGEWDPPFTHCLLECGTKRVDAATLAVGAKDALVNEYPWVAAIYNKNKFLICGGTLISRNFVLSAAHCFTSTTGVHQKAEDFTIIAGKYYRDFTMNEKGSQKRKIRNLYIHEDYKGMVQRHRDDVALIEVEGEFTVSFEVQPVCVDWESAFEDIDFVTGKIGVISGWGYTQEGGVVSNVLKKLPVPFQPKDVCQENLPQDFSDTYTASDKICAGYRNNSKGVCSGDSGGGLCFKSDGSHYYIRGIVSLSVSNTVGCDSNHFALYTKVSKYLDWIEKKTRKIL